LILRTACNLRLFALSCSTGFALSAVALTVPRRIPAFRGPVAALHESGEPLGLAVAAVHRPSI